MASANTVFKSQIFPNSFIPIQKDRIFNPAEEINLNNTAMLTQAIELCRHLSEKNPHDLSTHMDHVVSQLIGIDITDLSQKERKEQAMHYAPDEKNEKELGWNPLSFLSLLTRDYFQLLYCLIYKEFNLLSEDPLSQLLQQDPKLYLDSFTLLFKEIVLILDAISILRAIYAVQAIADTEERNMKRSQLATELVKKAFSLSCDSEMVLRAGLPGHSFYISLKKIRDLKTNVEVIQVIVNNAGSGVNGRFPTSHPHRASQTHHATIEKDGTELIYPRILGEVFPDNAINLKKYLEGLIVANTDKDKNYAAAETYDYFAHLSPILKGCDLKPIAAQSFNNCVTHNFFTLQQNRLPAVFCDWLFLNSLMIIQKALTHSLNPNRRVSPLTVLDPIVEVLYLILKSEFPKDIIDQTQVIILKNLLFDKKIQIRKQNYWSKDIMSLLENLYDAATISFPKTESVDNHIDAFLELIKALPNTRELDFAETMISEKSAGILLKFVKDPKCKLKTITFDKHLISVEMQDAILGTLNRKKSQKSAAFFSDMASRNKSLKKIQPKYFPTRDGKKRKHAHPSLIVGKFLTGTRRVAKSNYFNQMISVIEERESTKVYVKNHIVGRRKIF